MQAGEQLTFPRTGLRTICVCIALELVFAVWLFSLDREVFLRFITAQDSASYTKVASALAQGQLLPSPRTLGYPLLLAPAYLLGGDWLAPYLIIAAQIICNLGLCALTWRLLQRMAPEGPAWLRSGAVMFVCWAGLGMATYLLTDLWAAFFFSIFLYGMLFWRQPWMWFLSSVCLAAATLLRPTFTFAPLLLPPVAMLLKRVFPPLTWSHIAGFAVASGLATSVSVAYQYASYGYLGPSSVLTTNVEAFLYHASEEGRMSRLEHKEHFEREIGRRAGLEFSALDATAQEYHARAMLRERALGAPHVYVAFGARTALKYLFCPVESVPQRLFLMGSSQTAFRRYLRPFLFLICLPVWLLALIPGRRDGQTRRVYYLVVLLFLAYVVGVTLVAPVQGERIRLPLLAFLMPIAVWNASRISAWWAKRVGD